MIDPLARLRAETASDIAAHADDEPVAPPPEGLNTMLADYFAGREETQIFTAALELLADREAAAPYEPRQSPVPRIAAIPPGTVGEALGLAGPELQRRLM